MKKTIVVGLLLVPLAFLVTACSPKQAIANKVAEKVAETAIQNETGANLDIDSSGNKVTLKSDDGSVEYSTGGDIKVPDNFIKEALVASDYKVVMATTANKGVSVVYVTDMSSVELKEKLINSMVQLGWEKAMELSTNDGHMISFTKVDNTLTVSIGENTSDEYQGKTLVTNIYSEN